LGITASVSQVIADVQAVYPTVRQVVCLEEYVSCQITDIFQQLTILYFVVDSTSTNASCLAETLTNIQTVTGTLDLSTITSLIGNFSVETSLPANVTCTDCIKEAYNIVRTNFPSAVTSVTGPLQSECGSAFVGQPHPLHTH
jgi:hypothetical protein